MRRQIDGVLLLDKPAGITSNRALQIVKRIFGAKKAGHTGSLDPIATGMLPICFGEATKFSGFLLNSDKVYVVSVQLGIETTTADSEGSITKTLPVSNMHVDRIAAVLASFVGTQEQIPPMFSAIKHQGRPLYELARQGIEIDRKPRSITLFSITLDAYSADTQRFHFTVQCTKGTYIRTLVEDIGRALECGAHVIGLHRSAVHPYCGAAMYPLSVLEAVADEAYEDLSSYLLPVESAVEVLPAVKLSSAAAFYLRMGQPIRSASPFNHSLVRLLSEDAKFLGIGEVSDGLIKPRRLLANCEMPTAFGRG